ncbi:uncharacterized protein LOC121920501 [Sceloporus undulatus]|uniref:uncharacterized protein LOC121920501 n=1 Tax=Sceloporus undulatus TaxID=8520 RepID=UPI001C4AB130|nr:uncharacterized protein LOC121920501 [Sceloporus undulatus]
MGHLASTTFACVGQTAPQAHSIVVPLRVRPRSRRGQQVAHHPEDGWYEVEDSALITIRIWEWCIQHQDPATMHSPARRTEQPGGLSQQVTSTCHEWRLHPEVVSQLVILGNPPLDLFASRLKAQTANSVQGLLKMLADHNGHNPGNPWWPNAMVRPLLKRARTISLEHAARPALAPQRTDAPSRMQSLPLVAWRIHPENTPSEDPQGTAVFVGLTHPRGHVKGIRVAEIYPYEKISQYGPSGNSSVALLLLQNPITFGTHVTRMTFSPTVSWDSCKVMGLQMLQPGEVQTNPNAYQVKVLLPSDCAKVHPGVNPAMHCTLKDNSTQLPAGAVGEGAALLCHMEEEDMPWSQVGLVSEPFPGSQTVFLSSCINFYVDWIEETSKKARHLLQLSHGSVICRPNTWLLLLILSFLGGAELG